MRCALPNDSARYMLNSSTILSSISSASAAPSSLLDFLPSPAPLSLVPAWEKEGDDTDEADDDADEEDSTDVDEAELEDALLPYPQSVATKAGASFTSFACQSRKDLLPKRCDCFCGGKS